MKEFKIMRDYYLEALKSDAESIEMHIDTAQFAAQLVKNIYFVSQHYTPEETKELVDISAERFESIAQDLKGLKNDVKELHEVSTLQLTPIEGGMQ